MKILMSGAYRYSFARAFQKLGCQAEVFDDEEIYRQQLKTIKNKYSNRLFWRLFSHLVQKAFISRARKENPELILVIKGWYFSDPMLREIKRQLPQAKLFCFNPDNPFNTWHFSASNNWIRQSIPLYDVYFIWGRFLMEKLKQAGARRVEYLPFGYDPQLHFPAQVSQKEKNIYSSDIVFVGNWDEEREYWLKELVDFDLGLWGEPYWKNRCRDRQLRARYKGSVPHGEGVAKILGASGICINILRRQNKASHNMRTFEAPACKAFVLSERSQEAKDFFEEDREAAYFSSIDELKEKCTYYLKHPEEREAIALAGYQRCLRSNCTYFDRARQILDVYRGP